MSVADVPVVMAGSDEAVGRWRARMGLGRPETTANAGIVRNELSGLIAVEMIKVVGALVRARAGAMVTRVTELAGPIGAGVIREIGLVASTGIAMTPAIGVLARTGVPVIRVTDLPARTAVAVIRVTDLPARTAVAVIRVTDLPARTAVGEIRVTDLPARTAVAVIRVTDLPARTAVAVIRVTDPLARSEAGAASKNGASGPSGETRTVADSRSGNAASFAEHQLIGDQIRLIAAGHRPSGRAPIMRQSIGGPAVAG
jgi:hypothetical protein